MKEFAFRSSKLGPGNYLFDYAELLGGEINGNFITCPGPGRSPDDRSCHVRVSGGGGIYIYDCEGSRGEAYLYVCEKLGLEPPPRWSDKSNIIERIWRETGPGNGTLVESYLRSRKLTLPIPDSLRFHPRLKHGLSGSGFWPAMVACRTDVNGHRVAIHRTFIDRSGRGKAKVDPVRMDLGPAKGTAIRLSPLADELVIGEGIETTLSVMQATGKPGWAAGSASMMRFLELPPEVHSVLVLADGDAPGEHAACYSANRWRRAGRQVRICRAPWGKDFNDVLVEESE